ncbi:MAG TPA: NUDIX domain-containing protein [Patescibacteria group bacterium]|nr:NUDIX domain-containing protein [Patescibacteria group bacterium]
MKKGIDYVGVGIGAVIVRDGKIFLSKRGKKAKNEVGKWECPGGGLEFGEQFEDCIKREIKEEFDCEIQPLEMVEPVNHLIPEENQHWVALAYICKLTNGEPKIAEPEKSEAIGWFTISEMETMSLTLATKERLRQMKERIKHV